MGPSIEITVDPKGDVTGFIKTAVGLDRVIDSKTGFPVIGYVNGNFIGIVVRWAPGTSSVTTFTGELKTLDTTDTSKDEISTFTLTKVGGAEKDQWRNTVIT